MLLKSAISVRDVVVRVRCDEALVRLMSTRLGRAELSSVGNTARLVQPAYAYAYAASQPITMLAHANATDRLKRLER